MTMLPDRFWSKVDRTEGCWLWTASTNRGYGQYYVKEHGRAIMAHRVAYEALVGPIPPGLVIDHLCRVHACVNPVHLEAVTQRENLLRGVGASAQNALKTRCPKGHAYDDANTMISNGQRRCRECLLLKLRERRVIREAPSTPTPAPMRPRAHHPQYEAIRGERSPFWTGDDATYQAIHQRLRKWRGPARNHACVACGDGASDWAYDHQDPDERQDETGLRPWSVNLEHYQPMCRSCHRFMDRAREDMPWARTESSQLTE